MANFLPWGQISLRRLSYNPPEALDVILSEAKNLIDLSTYTFEILRLKPQNDFVGQAPKGGISGCVLVRKKVRPYGKMPIKKGRRGHLELIGLR